MKPLTTQPQAPIKHSAWDWLALLDPAALPVDAQIRQRALDKLQTPSANSHNLAQIIAAAPSLCLRLFSEVNQRLADGENQAHQLEHCISLLGMERCQQLIEQSPLAEDPQQPHYRDYRQQQIISLHAAHQARQWSRDNGHWHSEDVYWASLFQRSALWALHYQAPETATALQQARANSNGSQADTLWRQQLGCSLPELCRQAAEQWQLPHLCRQSWDTLLVGDSRHWLTPRRDQQRSPSNAHPPMPHQQHSAWPVALANRLAEDWEWQADSRRCRRLLVTLAASLQQTADDSGNRCRQQAAEFSRHCVIGGLQPAAQLLCHYRKSDDLLPLIARDEPPAAVTNSPVDDRTRSNNLRDDNPEATLVEIVASSSAELQREPDLTALPCETVAAIEPSESLEEFIERLQHRPASFDSRHMAMAEILQILQRELKIERSSIVLFNAERGELRTFYSLGLEPHSPLKHFRHRIKNNDFFHMLLKKPAGFQLHAGNRKKFTPLLPIDFKNATDNSRQFYIMSIFNGPKAHGIIYGDRQHSLRDMSSDDYGKFKRLCQAVSQYLKQSADI